MSFIDGHWNLVTDVDGPLLAGAPLVVPHGVAAVTGTLYDVPWRIPGRLGPQSVRWRAQGAAIGPVHRYLADAGAGPGDRGILRSARRLRRRSQLGLAEAVEQAYRLWA